MQNLTSLSQTSVGNITCSKNFTITGTTTMSGAVDLSGATVTGMTLTGSVVAPDADDGAALGSTSLKWSDLFLASGAVVNFNSGDVTLTHSTGTLTMNNLLTLSGNTGLTFTGSAITKGINFASATPGFADSDDAFIAVGTYNDAFVVANTSAFSFVPIQVNLSSTADCSSAGQQIAAMRLRVDTDTGNGQNTAISVAQLRSDLGASCYAFSGISQSANVSANITVEPGEFQVAFWQITGAGNIACTTGNVSVIEARMAGTGTGVDYVGLFSVNSAATLTSVIKANVGAGTVTNGIEIAGTMTTGISIPSTCTTGLSCASPIVTTYSNPSAAYNGVYTSITAANTFSGSVVGIRSTVTSSATAGIGNVYAGRFELIQSALPSSQGHTCALMAQTTVTGATNNPTSVLTLTLAGATGGQTTPFILFQDNSTEKSTILFAVGSTGNVVGTASGDIYYNEGLRILVNTAARYIPLSTAEGTFTTAYPIITTKTNAAAAYNQIYVSGSEANTYTGSIVGIRSTMTCSATAGIGNMYAGRFELIQSALPSSQGHTCGLYVQVTPGGTGNNPTSVLTLCRAGDSTGTNTPFINFLDANTNKTKYLFEIGTGNAVGTNTDGTALFETSASIGDVNEITAGLRVKVNGVDYYLLMATPADIQD